MRKDELAAAIAEKSGQKKAVVESVLEGLGGVLKETLSVAGAKIKVHGVATFESKITAARTGRNPQTGAALQIPERLTIRAKSQVQQDA